MWITAAGPIYGPSFERVIEIFAWPDPTAETISGAGCEAQPAQQIATDRRMIPDPRTHCVRKIFRRDRHRQMSIFPIPIYSTSTPRLPRREHAAPHPPPRSGAGRKSNDKRDVSILTTSVDMSSPIQLHSAISLVKGVSRDDPETAARAVPAGGFRNPALGRLRASTGRHYDRSARCSLHWRRGGSSRLHPVIPGSAARS